MDETSMTLMKEFRNKYLYNMKGASILDVGSRRVHSNQPTYRELFEKDYIYTGMDIVPGHNVDVVGYEELDKRFSNSFHTVISGQVMEHVKRPWEWLESLNKYFNKYICIIAPNKQREHRHPIDTYRYFPDGMRDLFEYARIIEIEIKKEGKLTIGIGEKKWNSVS
jgi:hypothetical protein